MLQAPNSAEADCADVGLIRTPSRMEMLYPRSQIVTAAKAYGLQAIDLVRGPRRLVSTSSP